MTSHTTSTPAPFIPFTFANGSTECVACEGSCTELDSVTLCSHCAGQGTIPADAIPLEDRGIVRALIAWLRDEAPLPWHPVGYLGSLPGWDEYAGEEITARAWARMLERVLDAPSCDSGSLPCPACREAGSEDGALRCRTCAGTGRVTCSCCDSSRKA